MKKRILKSVLIVFTILSFVSCGSDESVNEEKPITLSYMLNNRWGVQTVKNNGVTTTLENNTEYTMRFDVDSKKIYSQGKVNSCVIDYIVTSGEVIKKDPDGVIMCTERAGATELESVITGIIIRGINNFSGTEERLILKENNNSEVIFVKL